MKRASKRWLALWICVGLLPAGLLLGAGPGAGLLDEIGRSLARHGIRGYNRYNKSYQRSNRSERVRKILAEIPTNPDILINVTSQDMPGTADLTRLGRKATPALTRALLNNMDAGIRQTCAGVLGEIRDPASKPELVLALDDNNAGVRRNALSALGKLGQTDYVKRILKLVKNPEEAAWVKTTAIHALGSIGATKAFPLMFDLATSKDHTNLQDASVEALWLARGKVSQRKLVKLFTNIVEENQRAASRVIPYLGWLRESDAVEPLTEYYVGKSKWVKNNIIIAVGRIGGKKARKFLRKAIEETQEVRHLNNAAIALSKMGDKDWVVKHLLGRLADRRAYFRINAAFALGEVGRDSEAAIKGLGAALSDKNDYVRSEAAVALGRLRDKRAVPFLEKAVNTPNPFVQLDVVIALNRIDYKKYKSLIERVLLVHERPEYQRIRERGIRFLAEAGDKAAVPHILTYLRSGSYQGWDRAFKMLKDLETFEHDQFRPPLLEAVLSNRNSRAGAAALSLIRSQKIGKLVPFLVEGLYHAWGDRKKRLYLTLGKVADPGDMERIRTVQEINHSTKLYQYFALANLGDEVSLDRLIDVLKGGSLGQKRDAAFLLGYLDREAAQAKLLPLLDDKDLLTGINAAYALLPHDVQPAYDYLYKAMKKASPAMAQEAERTFRVSPAKGILPYLKKREQDEKDLIMRQRLATLIYQKEPREFR